MLLATSILFSTSGLVLISRAFYRYPPYFLIYLHLYNFLGVFLIFNGIALSFRPEIYHLPQYVLAHLLCLSYIAILTLSCCWHARKFPHLFDDLLDRLSRFSPRLLSSWIYGWILFRLYLFGQYGYGAIELKNLSHQQAVPTWHLVLNELLVFPAEGSYFLGLLALAVGEGQRKAYSLWIACILFFIEMVCIAHGGRAYVMYTCLYVVAILWIKRRFVPSRTLALASLVLLSFPIAFSEYYQQIRFNYYQPPIRELTSSHDLRKVYWGLLKSLVPRPVSDNAPERVPPSPTVSPTPRLAPPKREAPVPVRPTLSQDRSGTAPQHQPEPDRQSWIRRTHSRVRIFIHETSTGNSLRNRVSPFGLLYDVTNFLLYSQMPMRWGEITANTLVSSLPRTLFPNKTYINADTIISSTMYVMSRETDLSTSIFSIALLDYHLVGLVLTPAVIFLVMLLSLYMAQRPLISTTASIAAYDLCVLTVFTPETDLTNLFVLVRNFAALIAVLWIFKAFQDAVSRWRQPAVAPKV